MARKVHPKEPCLVCEARPCACPTARSITKQRSRGPVNRVNVPTGTPKAQERSNEGQENEHG